MAKPSKGTPADKRLKVNKGTKSTTKKKPKSGGTAGGRGGC